MAFVEQEVAQRVGEQIAYEVDTASYGGSPTTVAVTLEERQGLTWSDVSAERLIGANGGSGDTILTKLVTVEADKSYRLTVAFVSGGRTWRPWVIIHGVD